jgi:phage shock protein PspC (stress-responsive transcriptional regulator)
MLKGAPNWGVRTGFFFACTGLIVVVIAWFIVPETARVGPCSLQ